MKHIRFDVAAHVLVFAVAVFVAVNNFAAEWSDALTVVASALVVLYVVVWLVTEGVNEGRQ